MSIAKIGPTTSKGSVTTVTAWLKANDDEPLWLLKAQFTRELGDRVEMASIWKSAMSNYMEDASRASLLPV